MRANIGDEIRPLLVTAPAFQIPEVIVPTVARLAAEVIAACVAPVTVAAVPLALPVKAPVKVVAVTLSVLGLTWKPELSVAA